MQRAAAELDLPLPQVDDSRVRDIWWSRLYESKLEMQQRLQRLMHLVRPGGERDHVLVCHSLLIQRLFKAGIEIRKATAARTSRPSSKLRSCGAESSPTAAAWREDHTYAFVRVKEDCRVEMS